MEEKDYYEFIQPYQDAMQMMEMRIRTSEHALYDKPKGGGHPIHFLTSRIKSKASIEGKLAKKGKAATVDNAKDYLQDIAGVRIICYFVEDIYKLLDVLKRQSDLILVRESDYIQKPKPNGYRSYHAIFGVPVFCIDAMEYFPVEVQIRTIAMDFWASMEHRVSYKKDVDNREQMTKELLEYADTLISIEQSFEKYNDNK